MLRALFTITRPSVCLPVRRVYHRKGGTAAAVPPPFRPGNPALCGSRPLVTPDNCRLRNLLFLFVYVVFVYYFVCVCICLICVFFVFLYSVFLQYFDTVGWVFWPVKFVGHITYTVFRKKNSHSHFHLYLHELFVHLNKNCSEYTQGLIDSNNVKIGYSLWSMT